MNTIKRMFASLMPVLLVIAVAMTTVNLYDRFTVDNTASVFYVESVDATCIVVKEHGSRVMSCMPGDRIHE